MSLPMKSKLNDLFLGEMNEYVRIQNKFNRTTTGQYSFTSSSSGIFYTTMGQGVYDNGGENAMGLLLYNNVLKNYIFDSDTYNLIRTTVGDVETDVSDLQTDLLATATNLDIISMAKTTTGSTTAYAVDTAGTFDITKDGNRIMIVPNVTNTGTATLNVDAIGAKNLRKANDAGTYVALEAGDIKQGAPVEFVWSVANDFFILRPSGGASIKSLQTVYTTLSTETTKSIPITQVDVTKSVIIPIFAWSTDPDGYNTFATLTFDSTGENVVAQRHNNGATLSIGFTVVEYNGVKSKQVISTTATTSTNVTISSVNLLKSQIFCTGRLTLSSAPSGTSPQDNHATGAVRSFSFTTPTNINIQAVRTASPVVIQVLEFK